MTGNADKKKTILITGASSGIGKSIALEAAKKGYRLVLVARDLEKLEKVADDCRKWCKEPVYFGKMDLRNPQEIKKMVAEIYKEAGNIDILVNNAGFGLTDYFLNADLNKAEEMFQVNVFGLMHLTQEVALRMTQQKKGHIFMIASMAGKLATPKSSLYSAGKAAVIAFANGIRLELEPMGIRVTTVNPGPVDTPFFDQFDPEGTYLSKIDKHVLTSEQIAVPIMRTIGKKKREINLPFVMDAGAKLSSLFPSIADWMILNFFDKK